MLCSCTLSFSPSASRRDAGRNDEKVKAIKAKFEGPLSDLKTELKTLKSARKEHAKAMKKNVSFLRTSEVHV